MLHTHTHTHTDQKRLQCSWIWLECFPTWPQAAVCLHPSIFSCFLYSDIVVSSSWPSSRLVYVRLTSQTLRTLTMISVCFRASSWTWTATALWRRVWWRKAKRCSSSSPPTNQVPSLFLPHTHTHTGGHIVATTPFHSLLIFGLTERPSEGRAHINVAPKERRREIKTKKRRRREGETEEEEEEREEEEPAGWKWLTGGEVSQSYFRFSQNIFSRTEKERERGERESGGDHSVGEDVFSLFVI